MMRDEPKDKLMYQN